jgi:hypothetical protein
LGIAYVSGIFREPFMTMRNARIAIAVVGILLPYMARLPGGMDWLHQYTDVSFFGFLFFGVFNAIAWGGILAFSFVYKRPIYLIFPALFGFGSLAPVHYWIDLSADAQSALLLVFVPIYALVPIGIGGAIGYLLDRRKQ